MTQAVIHSRDPDGREVVGVPLGQSADRAWLYRQHYEAIVARFGTAAWFANPAGHGRLYVRLWNAQRGNNEMVARLVMGEPPRRRIRYRDGNRLNLRSSNLEVCRPVARPTRSFRQFEAAQAMAF